MPLADRIQRLDPCQWANKDPINPAHNFLAIGLSLRILQLNVEGLSAAKQTIVIIINIMNHHQRLCARQQQPGIERVQALADILHSALCCHSNETHALIANPPNSIPLDGKNPYHSPMLHLGPCSSVGMRWATDRHTDTDTHTDGRDHYTFRIILRLTRNVTTAAGQLRQDNVTWCQCISTSHLMLRANCRSPFWLPRRFDVKWSSGICQLFATSSSSDTS